jgi:hypothetical protein
LVRIHGPSAMSGNCSLLSKAATRQLWISHQKTKFSREANLKGCKPLDTEGGSSELLTDGNLFVGVLL